MVHIIPADGHHNIQRQHLFQTAPQEIKQRKMIPAIAAMGKEILKLIQNQHRLCIGPSVRRSPLTLVQRPQQQRLFIQMVQIGRKQFH